MDTITKVVIILFVIFLLYNMKEGMESAMSPRMVGAVQTASSPLFSRSSTELNIDGRVPSKSSMPYSKRLPDYTSDLYPAAREAFNVSSSSPMYDIYGLSY